MKIIHTVKWWRFDGELIAKGYGCGRKRKIGYCDGGCRGLPILLDNSVLSMRNDIVTWFDKEVSCLQKK